MLYKIVITTYTIPDFANLGCCTVSFSNFNRCNPFIPLHNFVILTRDKANFQKHFRLSFRASYQNVGSSGSMPQCRARDAGKHGRTQS